MADDDEDWVDPFGEAVDRLNAAGVTADLLSGVTVVGEPGHVAGEGPEWLRLEHRGDITQSDRERIRLLMDDVPYEFAHITTTSDGKHVLDDGTVIGGWLYANRPDTTTT